MKENVIQKDAWDLIYLVSCAVNNEKPDVERCKAIDLEAVYYLAQAHYLTSAVSCALERITELPRPYDQAKKKAIHKLALFDIEREMILNELEKNSVLYLPLKGILLKNCYPLASMREMSDNDILCDAGKMDVVRSVMISLGYCCEQFGSKNHDVYTKQPTMEFEMHRALFDIEEMPDFVEYYEDLKDRLVKDEDKNFGYHMTDEDFYIYLICHIYKHYRGAGTGLRSLLDICLYNRKFYGGLNKEYLNVEFSKLRITDYEQGIRNLANKVFDLEELSEDDRDQLDYYLKSGVHGTNEKREYIRAERALAGDDSNTAKRKYFLKRVFISGEALEKNYPFVYKHKVLYPLLFVYRPIKGAVKRPKGIAKEVKRIKDYKNINNDDPSA